MRKIRVYVRKYRSVTRTVLGSREEGRSEGCKVCRNVRTEAGRYRSGIFSVCHQV